MRANLYLQPTAPAATAKQERATGRRQAPLLHHQQISTLRSLREKGPGMSWKVACQERQCLRGGANSAQISGAPWSNSCALYMVHRRRTQHNDQSNCDLNFSHYARPAPGVVAMASFPRLD